MNWFPVLAAMAIVFAAFLGIDNPSRTILLQIAIASVTLAGLGIEWWKDSRPSVRALETETGNEVMPFVA